MKAMTLRRRDDGELLFHFTLSRIDLPEEPLYWPRVWGGNAETEGEAIVESIRSRCVGAGEHAERLKFDDGDAYIEALARSFDGDELYSAELVDSPDELNGDDRPVEIADYSPELPRRVPGASATPPDDRGARFPSAS